jgi:hypothetical protein
VAAATACDRAERCAPAAARHCRCCCRRGKTDDADDDEYTGTAAVKLIFALGSLATDRQCECSAILMDGGGGGRRVTPVCACALFLFVD